MRKNGAQLSGPIDVHAHVVDPESLRGMVSVASEYAPRLVSSDGAWGIELPPGLSRRHAQGVVRPVVEGLIDPEVRLRDMQDQQVTAQALSGYTSLNFYSLPAQVAAEFHAIQNDAMVRMAASHPGRFLALPGLPMQDTERAVAEVKRLASFPEVVGVGIGSNIDGKNLDDPAFEGIWEALDAHDLPVLVHPPGLVAGEERMGKYHLVNLVGNPLDTTLAVASIIYSGVLDRYSRLRFCFVHGGGFVPYQIGRWDHGWRVRGEAREFIDRRPSEYLASCYFDSLTHSPGSLEFLATCVGWDQVLLGTDYPWDMSTTTPIEDLERLDISDEVRDRIGDANVRQFLRFAPS